MKWGLIVLISLCAGTSLCIEWKHAAIVCDAGSTGTRVYSFRTSDDGLNQVEMKLLGKITPGIAKYSINYQLDEFVDKFTKLVSAAINTYGLDIPVIVLGTGGVRNLSENQQLSLWKTFRQNLLPKLPGYSGDLKLEAIEGTAEAFYGLVSANHIFESGIGVLDLGGSSVEIAHVGEDGIVGTSDDVLVTHAQLGTEKIRGTAAGFCDFGHTSNGGRCRTRIREIILEQNINKLLLGNSHEFIAISAFVYSLDFGRWLLTFEEAPLFYDQYPRPSVNAVREACDAVCSKELDVNLFQKHYLTNAVEATGRCFDICFVAELMTSFGLGEDERRVNFVKDLNGKEVEWTLGYYITHILRYETSNEEL